MENISKTVVTSDGKKIGYILDIAVDFDDMKKLGYYVVDEESETEFLLRSDDILSQSEKYILIDVSSVLEFVTERETVFGKKVLDLKCQEYGRLRELSFKRKKCEKFITDKCEISSKFVEAVGQDFIVVNFHRKRKSVLQRYAFSHLESETIVQIQTTPVVTMPERVSLSAAFYIGKISSEDILGYNNEKIVQKGEAVVAPPKILAPVFFCDVHRGSSLKAV